MQCKERETRARTNKKIGESECKKKGKKKQPTETISSTVQNPQCKIQEPSNKQKTENE